MRIIAISDIHSQTDRLEKIIGLREADLILIAGDLTHFGGRKEASRVLEAISSFNPNILAIHGNLDRPEVDFLLEERQLSLHGAARIVGGLGMIGVGGSNPTPFCTPCEYSEKEIDGLLQEGLRDLEGHRPFLLLSHSPPVQTEVDRLPSGMHVGSRAVRSFIEHHRPAYCLCGHIHESRGTDRLGPTVIINPGTLQKGGWLEINFQENEYSHSLQSCG